jgi:hypothetical protein
MTGSFNRLINLWAGGMVLYTWVSEPCPVQEESFRQTEPCLETLHYVYI